MARIRSCWYVTFDMFDIRMFDMWYVEMYGTILWYVCKVFWFPLYIVWCWYQVGEQSKDVTLMYGLFLVIINHEKWSWFIDEFVHFPNVRTNLWYLYVPSIDQQTKDLEFQPSKHHVVCINGFGVYVLLKETPFFFSHLSNTNVTNSLLQSRCCKATAATTRSTQNPGFGTVRDQIDLTPEG